MLLMSLGYDISNRLVQATHQLNGIEQYAYDAENRRVWVREPSGTEYVFLYAPDGTRLGQYQVSPPRLVFKKMEVYFAGRLFWQEESQTGWAVVTDRLGSGNVISGQRENYYPYGEGRVGTGSHFATYWRQGTTNLDYAMNRWYSNQLSRFTTPDPYAGSADPSDPQSWNRYAYVQNDPVNFADPSGLLADPCQDGDTDCRNRGGAGNCTIDGSPASCADAGALLRGGAAVVWNGPMAYSSPNGPVFVAFDPHGNPFNRIGPQPAGANGSAVTVSISFGDGSATSNTWSRISPYVHLAADLGGWVPVFGDFIDLGNAALYGLEGNAADSALSLLATVPVVGDSGKVRRIADAILNWLGPGARVLPRTSRDTVLRIGSESADALREARFDLDHPKPHVNLEVKPWRNAYPGDQRVDNGRAINIHAPIGGRGGRGR